MVLQFFNKHLLDFQAKQLIWNLSFYCVVSDFEPHDRCTRVYVVCLCHCCILQSISISEQQLCWCVHQTTAGKISFVITTQCSFASLHVQFWVCELMSTRMKPETWSRSKLWGLTDQVETELSLGRTGRGSKGWCGKRGKCRTNGISGSADNVKLLICLLPAGPCKSFLKSYKSDNLLYCWRHIDVQVTSWFPPATPTVESPFQALMGGVMIPVDHSFATRELEHVQQS